MTSKMGFAQFHSRALALPQAKAQTQAQTQAQNQAKIRNRFRNRFQNQFRNLAVSSRSISNSISNSNRQSTSAPRLKKQIGKASRRAAGSDSVEAQHEWAPFISVAFFIVALFSVVLCKMELRRVGYSVLKLTREERSLRDEQREQMIQLARMTRPERLQAVAQSRLTLKKAEAGQIIQMTQQGVALK